MSIFSLCDFYDPVVRSEFNYFPDRDYKYLGCLLDINGTEIIFGYNPSLTNKLCVRTFSWAEEEEIFFRSNTLTNLLISLRDYIKIDNPTSIIFDMHKRINEFKITEKTDLSFIENYGIF